MCLKQYFSIRKQSFAQEKFFINNIQFKAINQKIYYSTNIDKRKSLLKPSSNTQWIFLSFFLHGLLFLYVSSLFIPTTKGAFGANSAKNVPYVSCPSSYLSNLLKKCIISLIEKCLLCATKNSLKSYGEIYPFLFVSSMQNA